MNNLIEKAIEKTVEKYKPLHDDDYYSIKECAQNYFLQEDFDSLEFLKFTLMAQTIKDKYALGEDEQ